MCYNHRYIDKIKSPFIHFKRPMLIYSGRNRYLLKSTGIVFVIIK